MALVIVRPSYAALPLASVRNAVGRTIDWFLERLRVPPPGLRTPWQVTSRDVHPVVLLVLVDTHETALRRTLEALPALCEAADIRAVLVLDRPDLAAARKKGVPVELLPDPDAWERRPVQLSWPELVKHRLTIMRRDYAAAAVVEVSKNGLCAADVPRLAAEIQADTVVRRQRAWWLRRVIATVRLIDRPVVR
jgi:hypothetical protein